MDESGDTSLPPAEMSMEINVTFRHMNPSQNIREYAQTKFKRFERYLHEPIDVHVVLHTEKIRQIAEVTVKAKNFHFHGVEESPDLYASIDLLEGKMETHLKKHKEKIKDHRALPLHEVVQELNGTV